MDEFFRYLIFFSLNKEIFLAPLSENFWGTPPPPSLTPQTLLTYGVCYFELLLICVNACHSSQLRREQATQKMTTIRTTSCGNCKKNVSTNSRRTFWKPSRNWRASTPHFPSAVTGSLTLFLSHVQTVAPWFVDWLFRGTRLQRAAGFANRTLVSPLEPMALSYSFFTTYGVNFYGIFYICSFFIKQVYLVKNVWDYKMCCKWFPMEEPNGLLFRVLPLLLSYFNRARTP